MNYQKKKQNHGASFGESWQWCKQQFRHCWTRWIEWITGHVVTSSVSDGGQILSCDRKQCSAIGALKSFFTNSLTVPRQSHSCGDLLPHPFKVKALLAKNLMAILKILAQLQITQIVKKNPANCPFCLRLISKRLWDLNSGADLKHDRKQPSLVHP